MHKCCRVEMKKFGETKGPMNMLKIKMGLKAESNSSFSCWTAELGKVCDEQSKFLEKVEYQVAVAENSDPAQVGYFLICGPRREQSLLDLSPSCLYIYIYIYIHVWGYSSYILPTSSPLCPPHVYLYTHIYTHISISTLQHLCSIIAASLQNTSPD